MSIQREAVLTLLKAFFEARAVVVSEADFESFDFVAAGVLDSFEVLSMIMHIEAHLGLSVPPELLLDTRNAQVGRFADAIVALA
ncbi:MULTISPECIES: phosphopantetheine-binding protein [unclassified Pseudoalteromonas]|uniref:phosphopantetheine-binding protein n=1 Tax=unclassified Pseudoalteromonas TaxID=194690 RepID=UPI002096BDBA|nr:phosphopantetheine-binding protein [Pseudoalteromonas sp. XMcav2-N]MCO7190027.1 phosphopantetheine-binding protein [Pseudoalteromonas sp. XMcav2-N]